MIYLILAVASSAMVSVCMRFSEKYVKNEMSMFMANYAVCVGSSFLCGSGWNKILPQNGCRTILILGIISGALYLAGFIFLRLSMKYNGIVLSSTFMKLGVLIPTLMAVAVFHEKPSRAQMLGICLSLAAIIMIHFEKEALQEGNKKGWLLIILAVSGISDSMANIYEQMGSPEGKDGYLFITFLTAFLLALAATGFNRKGISVKDIFFGVMIGIPNYFSARFLLLALGRLEAVLVYPMYSVAGMIVITLAGILIFHERLGRKKAYAMGFIAAAVCLLNL